jgi:hypothetical protein
VASSYLQVPDKTTPTVKAEPNRVEQIFRFDDAEITVKAPPEVRQKISYSKQQKDK